MNKTKKVVVALIKNNSEKYLLVNLANYYPSYPEHADEWCPVAGHIIVGESARQAIKREVYEEMHLDVKPIKAISKWQQDIPGETAEWWKASIIGGDIRPNKKEINRWGYFSAEKIKNMKLWPATRKFFEKYIWTDK